MFYIFEWVNLFPVHCAFVKTSSEQRLVLFIWYKCLKLSKLNENQRHLTISLSVFHINVRMHFPLCRTCHPLLTPPSLLRHPTHRSHIMGMCACVSMGYLSIYFTLHWHYSSFVVVINWIRFISIRLNEVRFGLLLMFPAMPEHTLRLLMCVRVCVCVHGCKWVCVCVCVQQGPFLLTCSKDFAYLNILNIKGQPPRLSIQLTFRNDHLVWQTDARCLSPIKFASFVMATAG